MASLEKGLQKGRLSREASVRTLLAENSASAVCTGCSRRQFLTDSALLAVSAILVSACGDGVIGAGSGTVTGPVDATIKLSDYPSLATDGGIAALTGLSTPAAVVRKSSSSYLAFSLICPHQGSTIGVLGSGFRCPNHLAQFNSSGTWTGGQQTSNMKQISVTLDATAGTIKLGSVI